MGLTTELDHKFLTPRSIEVDEQADTVTIVMPLCAFDTQSASGKMDVLCTTNGWLKTQELCPRTAKPITVQIFVGTNTGKK
jgi:hypothetical protein